MKTSASGVAAIAFFEGERDTAYRDATGVWTIGVGHAATSGLPPIPVEGMTITHAQALEILAADLPVYEAAVTKRFPSVPQHVFDGAVSFCFNVGEGNFASASWPKLYAAGNMAGAEASLKLWDRGGGQVLAGLVRRRSEEADIIFSDKYPNGITSPTDAIIPSPKPDTNSETISAAAQRSWLQGLLAELFPAISKWFEG